MQLNAAKSSAKILQKKTWKYLKNLSWGPEVDAGHWRANQARIDIEICVLKAEAGVVVDRV